MRTLQLTTIDEADVLTIEEDEVRPGWERRYLLMSDLHLDNPHCRRDLVKLHLDQAREKKALAFLFGDTFCAMDGKYDGRRSKSGIRPENNNDRYLDSLVNNNADFLLPWKDVIELITDGNHENAVRDNCETDLAERLAEKLDCEAAGYSGWIRFLFSQKGKGQTQRRLFWHHGFGAGGEGTKNIQRITRMAPIYPDADIIVDGHVHWSWDVPTVRHRLSDDGKPYKDEQLHIQLSTYKDEAILKGGYHTKNGRSPRPLGGYWLRFYYRPDRLGNVGIQAIRAD